MWLFVFVIFIEQLRILANFHTLLPTHFSRCIHILFSKLTMTWLQFTERFPAMTKPTMQHIWASFCPGKQNFGNVVQVYWAEKRFFQHVTGVCVYFCLCQLFALVFICFWGRRPREHAKTIGSWWFLEAHVQTPTLVQYKMAARPRRGSTKRPPDPLSGPPEPLQPRAVWGIKSLGWYWNWKCSLSLLLKSFFPSRAKYRAC